MAAQFERDAFSVAHSQCTSARQRSIATGDKPRGAARMVGGGGTHADPRRAAWRHRGVLNRRPADAGTKTEISIAAGNEPETDLLPLWRLAAQRLTQNESCRYGPGCSGYFGHEPAICGLCVRAPDP